jgi:hypothetical protein
MKRETIKTILILAALSLIGCHRAQPEPQPSAAQQPAPPLVTGVVVQKPFFAVPHPFAAPGAQPSILLQLHARTDSPVPLLEYDKQKVYSLSAFDLRSSLSADELQRRLGPPAQLADYSDPWFVYRLNYGKELWLHFSQPDNLRLLAADIVRPQEDGYIRDRIFSADETR